MNATPTLFGRRALFQRTGYGLGAFALTQLLQQGEGAAPRGDRVSASREPHFPAQVKRVIYLHMVGAPSHLDLFEEPGVFPGTATGGQTSEVVS